MRLIGATTRAPKYSTKKNQVQPVGRVMEKELVMKYGAPSSSSSTTTSITSTSLAGQKRRNLPAVSIPPSHYNTFASL
jgi:hypothetical protein